MIVVSNKKAHLVWKLEISKQMKSGREGTNRRSAEDRYRDEEEAKKDLCLKVKHVPKANKNLRNNSHHNNNKNISNYNKYKYAVKQNTQT